ncbi:zinc finger protein 862-like [Acropora muricata]|uniref:zinc finger protein 862-like n=1 Tax=Acropora muricata TaxID=159855 RepID=UPI0034E56C23
MRRQNGVLKKIKDDVPHLIEMHCVAHRLELAILDAFKGESILTELKDLLQGIYKHYHYSPKALRELNELAQVQQLSVLKRVSVLGTRWTPHLHQALKVFLQNFTVIYTHFENTAASAAMQGRAPKTTKQMSDFKQVLFMHFMLDTLDVVSRLSLVMQKDAVTLAEVKDSIERTSLSIQAMVARPGAKLSHFLEVVANGNQFKGVELNRQDGDIATFNLIKQRVIGSMVAYLNARFANVSTNDVIAAFDIFNTSLWPDSDEELALYGEQEVNTLVGHFKLLLERNDFDSELVNQEWHELKVCIKNNHSQLKMLPM